MLTTSGPRPCARPELQSTEFSSCLLHFCLSSQLRIQINSLLCRVPSHPHHHHLLSSSQHHHAGERTPAQRTLTGGRDGKTRYLHTDETPLVGAQSRENGTPLDGQHAKPRQRSARDSNGRGATCVVMAEPGDCTDTPLVGARSQKNGTTRASSATTAHLHDQTASSFRPPERHAASDVDAQPLRRTQSLATRYVH